MALCTDPTRADDAVQETWLAAMRAPPRHDTNLRGWLGRALRSALRQGARGEQRRRRRESEHATVGSGFAEAADEAACRAELHRHLVQLVLALPEPQRTLVLLRYFDGLDVPALARRAQISPDAVRAHLRRARTSLRAQLDRRGGAAARGLALLLASMPRRGVLLGIAMTSKIKLALGALAVAAASIALVWSPSALGAPAPAGALPAAVVLATDGPSSTSPPATVADSSRTAIDAALAPVDGLAIRLTGVLPHAPWTAPLRLDLEGKVGSDRLEHEVRVEVEAGLATAPLPAWFANAESPQLRVDARDPFYLPIVERRSDADAKVRELTVTVHPVGVLTGRVIDAHGVGVAAARVAALALEVDLLSEVTAGETTTRADGTFTLQSRVEGSLLLVALPMQPAGLSGQRITLEGGAVADTGIPRDELLPASTPAEAWYGRERIVAPIVVEDAAWLTGVVRLPGGERVATAQVWGMDVVTKALSPSGFQRVTVADVQLLAAITDGRVLRYLVEVRGGTDGSFRLPLPPGRRTQISVLSAPAIDMMQRAQSLIATAPDTVEIELQGRLVAIRPTCKGQPIGKHLLLVRHASGPRAGFYPDQRPGTILADLDHVLTGSIIADGFESTNFRIPVATAAAVVDVEMVRLESTRMRLDLSAETHVRQAVLHCKALDASGAELERRVFRSDGEPWFELDLPPGRYRVRVQAPQRSERRDRFLLPSMHEIEVGREPAQLRLPVEHGGNILLEVVDARGLPLAATVELTRDGARQTAAWLAAKTPTAHSPLPRTDRVWSDGPHTLIESLASGSYALNVMVEGRDARRVEVAVKQFEVAAVRVQY